MRIFVAGSSGQLARALAARGARRGHLTETFGRPRLDLASGQDPLPIMAAFRPDAVINAAAYTSVDDAESEAALAFAVNRDGAGRLARAAAKLDLPFLHVSTDYVFDGEKGAGYVESDPTGPLGVYGRSKFAGEQAVLAGHPAPLIARTGWVYGPDGRNFATTMVRLAAERDRLDIVSDRHGSPTFADDLADALLSIAEQGAGKRHGALLYHIAGSDDASWLDLAAAVIARLSEAGLPVPVLHGISGDAYPAAAARPRDSRLDSDALARDFAIRLPGWPTRIGLVVDRVLAKQR